MKNLFLQQTIFNNTIGLVTVSGAISGGTVTTKIESPVVK